MTVREAIDAARELRDTEITDARLVEWLTAHDQTFVLRCLKNYNPDADVSALPYTQYLSQVSQDNDPFEDVTLIIPDIFGLELYPIFLVMRIDLQHGDYERYNNDAMLYADLYQKMVNDYSRELRWKPPRPEDVPENAPWHPVTGLRF